MSWESGYRQGDKRRVAKERQTRKTPELSQYTEIYGQHNPRRFAPLELGTRCATIQQGLKKPLPSGGTRENPCNNRLTSRETAVPSPKKESVAQSFENDEIVSWGLRAARAEGRVLTNLLLSDF